MGTGLSIRLAEEKDLDEIMKIFAGARKYMEENGNPGQWVNGYPSVELIRHDLNGKCLYVCQSEEGIEGVFVFIIGVDPDYKSITGGCWKNDEPYGFMHRVASAGRRKGIASFCIDWCFKQCGNLRGDTHKDNKTMQHVFIKNGFEYCGTVYIRGNAPRMAYHKTEK